MGFLLESSPLEWLSLGLIFLTCIYYYFKSKHTYWEKKGCKYLKPSIPFGNVSDLILRREPFAVAFQKLYNMTPGEPFVGYYEVIKPSLLIRDPDLIKIMLVKDFTTFQNRGIPYNDKVDPLSAHLFLIGGTRWRKLRTKLSPTFTSGKMKIMFHLMSECADQIKEYLDKLASKGEMVEMKEVMAKFTTDVIGSCAFGLQFNSIQDENSEFRKMGRRIFQGSLNISRIIQALAPSVKAFLKLKVLPDEVTNFFIGVVKDTVEYREKNNVTRNDFMQLLIQLKNKGRVLNDNETDDTDHIDKGNEKNGVSHEKTSGVIQDNDIEFTDNLLAAQAFIFFVAGFETSSTTLSFCLYELARNPDIQEKLRQSIKSTIKDKPTYDDLMNSPYLDKVISETLRMYPPVGTLSRESVKPYVIPGTSVKLDVGQKILIPVYGLHHDPKYFPEPERFNPENFSEEAKASRPHYVYLPFGEGPRNCIGMRFGLLQTKLGLVTILPRFEFSVCEKTEIPIRLDPKQIITSSTTGAWLNVKKINT